MGTLIILERRIERRFVDRATAAGFLLLKLTPAGRRGYPDRLLLPPKDDKRRRGRCMFIEFKRPKAVPTKLQEHTHQDLIARGFTVVTVATVKECDTLLALMEVGV